MGTFDAGATSGALVDFFSNPHTLGVTPRAARFLAQRLRDDGLMRGTGEVGRGVRLNTNEAVSWMLGHALAPTLTKAASTIRHFRNASAVTAVFLPPTSSDGAFLSPDHVASNVAHFTRGLSFVTARTFGKALDALIDDMRSGVFAQWKEGVPTRITLEFHETGYAQIYLDRPHFNKSVVFGYGDNSKMRALERLTRIDGSILEGLAKALGPLT